MSPTATFNLVVLCAVQCWLKTKYCNSSIFIAHYNIFKWFIFSWWYTYKIKVPLHMSLQIKQINPAMICINWTTPPKKKSKLDSRCNFSASPNRAFQCSPRNCNKKNFLRNHNGYSIELKLYAGKHRDRIHRSVRAYPINFRAPLLCTTNYIQTHN